MPKTINLLTYLMRSRVFKFVFEHSPEFVVKHASFFEAAPFSNCAYRDYMKYAQDHLILRVLSGDPDYMIFDGLPKDVLESPVALDYVMKNSRVWSLVQKGALNYTDVLVMAGRRGDGKDGDPTGGAMARIKKIISTPDVYKGRE
jgi:hypothetical protein